MVLTCKSEHIFILRLYYHRNLSNRVVRGQFFGIYLSIKKNIINRFFLPDSPSTAKFLKGRDRVLAIERLRDNNMGTETKVWKWEQFWETFRDPKSYLWFSMLFLAA